MIKLEELEKIVKKYEESSIINKKDQENINDIINNIKDRLSYVKNIINNPIICENNDNNDNQNNINAIIEDNNNNTSVDINNMELDELLNLYVNVQKNIDIIEKYLENNNFSITEYK